MVQEQPMTALTPRQRQVLTLAANGHTNRQIGQALGIHPNTVDRHLAMAYNRLAARDRAHAVALALTAGLLPADAITPTRSST